MVVIEHHYESTSSEEDFVVDILDIYEGRYNVFKVMSASFDGKKILERINKLLHPVLNINIKTLYRQDFNSFLMIVSAFFGKDVAMIDYENTNKREWVPYILEEGKMRFRLEEGKDLLKDCHHPLHTVMVMCYVAHSMQQILLKDDFGQEAKNEKYKELKDKMEALACTLINGLYQKDCKEAKYALEVDYQSQFERGDAGEPDKPMDYLSYLKGRFDQSKEIMAIAYEAKAMKFLSQRPCLNLIRIRKTCRKQDFDDCEKHTMRSKVLARRMEQKSGCCTGFCKLTMREKLLFHVILRIVYILTFAFMLCCYPNYDEYDMNFWIIITFCYVLLVLFAQISMTILKLKDYVIFQTEFGIEPGSTKINTRSFFRLCHQYFNANSLSFYRMLLIIALLLLEAVRFVCFRAKRSKNEQESNFWYSFWTIIPISLELLYCSLFAIAAVSSLRLFHSFSALGFFVHLMKKMLKTVGMFVLIFLAFWFVLAVIHVSISRTLANPKGTLFYTIISEGKFEIFGEVRDEDRNGILADCSQFNRTVLDFWDMHYAEASCLFRGSAIPFLVFIYMFVAGVLLVNLLTAQLTKEYEEEAENSRYYVGYLQYEQLSKIESKLYLPPPLSLIYVFIRLFCCLCNYMFVCAKMFEGHSWGSVREDARNRLDSDQDIKDLLGEEPENAWTSLKEMIHKYDREGESPENLKKLKNELNQFLETRISEQEHWNHSRSRGPSVLESRQGIRLNEMTMVSSAVFNSMDDDDPRREVTL